MSPTLGASRAALSQSRLEVMGDRRMLAHWAQPAGTGMTDDRAETFLSQP